MTPWWPSRETTVPLRASCPKTTPGLPLINSASAELIDLIANIGLDDAENRSKDILGRVYEYFLGQFASAEGKKGGQFQESARLEAEIRANLLGLEYEI